MPRRYSDINRGPLLQQAYQRRQQYLARDLAERNATAQIGTRTSSPTVFVLVKPFGEDLGAEIDGYRVRTNQRNRQQLGDDIGNRAKIPAEADEFLVNGNYTPAKLKLFVKTSSSPATSRITGIRYLRANGQSYSHPFGSNAATDREFLAFNQIAIGLRNASPNNRVSYSPEKISEER
ncbi:hypothetical protein HJG54_35280 (plasmid) [Leptolyngbya sp. NK1-12]|uniref:Uncharacterized protein n=1 Tax=Leptolyngbya sp. NK1-12 TaxID=2547451 RepID=A0AA96WM15_9CYAN|nr:hypothetical protein [Leptolyngbya sp. NK1-12]WNZ28178.1 hypothetical protein HJG54_35280 [Leptolyngbya sp. NK1-12]